MGSLGATCWLDDLTYGPSYGHPGVASFSALRFFAHSFARNRLAAFTSSPTSRASDPCSRVSTLEPKPATLWSSAPSSSLSVPYAMRFDSAVTGLGFDRSNFAISSSLSRSQADFQRPRRNENLASCPWLARIRISSCSGLGDEMR